MLSQYASSSDALSTWNFPDWNTGLAYGATLKTCSAFFLCSCWAARHIPPPVDALSEQTTVADERAGTLVSMRVPGA